MGVAPLLFQAAFNFAPYPPVVEHSSRPFGLAPMGSRRFTISPGTSLSSDHPAPAAVSFLSPCPSSRPVGFPDPSRSRRRELPQRDPVPPSAALHLLTGTTRTSWFNYSPSRRYLAFDGHGGCIGMLALPWALRRRNCDVPCCWESIISSAGMGMLTARVVKHGQRRKVEGLVLSGPRVQISSLAPLLNFRPLTAFCCVTDRCGFRSRGPLSVSESSLRSALRRRRIGGSDG